MASSSGTLSAGPTVVSSTLGDASVHVNVGVANQFNMPAGTMTASRTITLDTTGAVANESLTIARLDTTANTLTIVNGGTGGGTLYTFPASKARASTFIFDGTNWNQTAHEAIN
jgi:hypothetical protein